jgi:predicted nucleic acid-binding protein
VRGYLVDVNHIRAHFEKRLDFMAKLRLMPTDTQYRACAVTLGEIEAGHVMSTSTNEGRRDEFAKFVIDHYRYCALEIAASTTESYSLIMGRIWQRHRPANKKTRTDAHLVGLGIDMNDVWMAASAWEHNLIMLTSDAMSCIREAIPELQFECWTSPPPASSAPVPSPSR